MDGRARLLAKDAEEAGVSAVSGFRLRGEREKWRSCMDDVALVGVGLRRRAVNDADAPSLLGPASDMVISLGDEGSKCQDDGREEDDYSSAAL